MATYFNNSSNQRDSSQMIYFREPLPNSYPEGNAMMFMNSGSYNGVEIPSIGATSSTMQQHEILSSLGGSRIGEHDFNTWRDGRHDLLVMQGGPAGVLTSRKNLQGQGLSLSLSTQIPSGIQVPSIPFQNHNSGFVSLLSPNQSASVEGDSVNGSSRDEQSMNAEYLPHGGFPGGNQDSGRADLSPFGMSNVARSVHNSRYLKAAQELLDEVVNVRKALKQSDAGKNQNAHECQNVVPSSDPQESSSDVQSELSHAERQDSQNKLTKLLSMLDEVDRRYKQYYHQMQIVVSSFDVIAGCGAAKPYTALALQTISRHFRCLRDAITTQIRTTRKFLGEQDTSANSGGISRLRYVDQHLRQQKALQQLGMMHQHAWRPQRGLPENSVSVLRAWLFEHFLHPYPKDSDKIMLARQTGLTRSQVSNWFINARVRLWKPMVEEMYKEEIVDAEMESNSSSDNIAKTTKRDNTTSDDKVEEFQQSTSSTATKINNFPDVEMTRTTTEIARPNAADDFVQDAMIQSEGTNGRFMAAAAAYHMSELGRLERGNGVSLTLGLQHCEGGNLPMSVAPHQSFATMGPYDMYNAAASSVDHETAEVESIDAGNRQHRFNSSHLLHDFVA